MPLALCARVCLLSPLPPIIKPAERAHPEKSPGPLSIHRPPSPILTNVVLHAISTSPRLATTLPTRPVAPHPSFFSLSFAASRPWLTPRPRYQPIDYPVSRLGSYPPPTPRLAPSRSSASRSILSDHLTGIPSKGQRAFCLAFLRVHCCRHSRRDKPILRSSQPLATVRRRRRADSQRQHNLHWIRSFLQYSCQSCRYEPCINNATTSN